METYGDIEPVGEFYTYYNYDWSIIGLWKGPLGYYLGTDSGCSCNGAWEYYNGPDDLTGPLTAEQAREEVESLVATSRYQGDEGVDEFLREIV